MQHHLASSKRAGLNLDDWRDLKAPADSKRFNEREKAALAYAERLTRPPTNEIEPEASEVRRHFDDEQLVDLTCLIALANLTNRITDGLGIELEFEPEKI